MHSNTLKIRIVTSCTGEKLFSPVHQLMKDDFTHLHDQATFKEIESRLEEYRTPAVDLYTGQQHLRLLRGIQLLQNSSVSVNVETWIVSAGYGLISGNTEIVPYECTFQKMKVSEVLTWSDHLCIPHNARNLFMQRADLVLVLLGDSYLRSLQLDENVKFESPTYFIVGSSKVSQVKGIGDVYTIPLNTDDTRRFGCGLVGLKGEIARRILLGVAKYGEEFIRNTLNNDDILSQIAEDDYQPKMTISSITMGMTDPNIDYVIDIPSTWWEKPHRKQMSYFIPDWDDMVDPNYDFETDTHSSGSGNWGNQVYSHQLYDTPNYDGILVSKAVIENSKTKKAMINELGVHRYLRVPEQFPVMGDCGAFSYVKERVPPYTTNEILEYYTNLGFNFGVSIDHLLFGAETADEQKERYQLTIQNAEDFITEHRKLGLRWKAIGAVQGWNPKTYAEAARAYIDMGYTYIGLGSLVRTRTETILSIVDAVSQVIPENIGVHLFGIARTKELRTFAKLGITSIDSASYLRKAWMSINRSYLTESGPYTTIRIPDVEGVIRKYKKREEMINEKTLRVLENEALSSIRSIARQDGDVDNCVEALIKYDEVARLGNRRDSLEKLGLMYKKTLEARPWEHCSCAICQNIGVEVVIFRGNNRNRRRGFHNTYVFYNVMQKLLNGEIVSSEWAPENQKPYQNTLFSFLENLKED